MNQIMPVETTGQITVKNTVFQPLPIEQIELIHDAETLPFDLMSDYWTPVAVGESRDVLFDRIEDEAYPDQNTGELIELPCAFFFWQQKKGEPIKAIRNGSKRLVGTLQRWNLPQLTPLTITYLGKAKNKNNGNFSDAWTINPKRINVTPKQ